MEDVFSVIRCLDFGDTAGTHSSVFRGGSRRERELALAR